MSKIIEQSYLFDEEMDKSETQILNNPYVFSYHNVEAQYGELKRGGQYAYTLTFGNMGDNKARADLSEYFTVDDLDIMVQLKMTSFRMDYRYLPVFVGYFYIPEVDEYAFGLLDLWQIRANNIEPIIFKGMMIFIYDGQQDTFLINLDPGTINCIGLMFQVTDIKKVKVVDAEDFVMCGNKKISKEIELFKKLDFDKLEPEELDIKLKELKEKSDRKLKQLREMYSSKL